MNTVESTSFSKSDLNKVSKCAARLKKSGQVPTPELVAQQTSLHWALVTAIMQSAQSNLTTKQVFIAQSESRSARAVYREPRKRKNSAKRRIVVRGEPAQMISKIMLDKCTPPEFVDQAVRMFNERSADQNAVRTWTDKNGNVHKYSEGGRYYEWRNQKCISHICRLPNWAGRLLMEILVAIRPIPELDARNTFVHGTNVFSIYTPEQLAFLSFAVQFAEWYSEPRITAQEYKMTGREYGRQLYRGNRLGHGGQNSRMLSDSERLDVLNRTCIVCFCPEIARSIPITDEGCGYVSCSSARVEWSIDQKIVETLREKNGKEVVRRHRMFEVFFTDNITGQKYVVRTMSLRQLERLKSMNGFYAVSKQPVVYTYTPPAQGGIFGSVEQIARLPWSVDKDEPRAEDVPAHIIELDLDSIAPYGQNYSYHRMLKYFTMNIFRFLFRRPTGVQKWLEEHKNSKMARKNFRSVHLYEFMRRTGMHEDGSKAQPCPEFPRFSEQTMNKISPAWADVCQVEMMMPWALPKTSDRRERRAEAFRLLWEERVNAGRSERDKKPCKMSKRQYETFRGKVFKKIAELMESEEQMLNRPPLPELRGSGPKTEWSPTYSITRAEIQRVKFQFWRGLGKYPTLLSNNDGVYSGTVDGYTAYTTEYMLSPGEGI